MSRVIDDIDAKIKVILNKAASAVRMMPADHTTLTNFRSTLATGMLSLQTKGYIAGYRIDTQLTPQNTLVGAVTYTPISTVDDVAVSFNMVTVVDKAKSYDRAMNGI